MSWSRHYSPQYAPLVRLGLPLVVGQLGQVTVQLADTMMVGNYGAADLAAGSFVNSLMALSILFLSGFSYGLIPLLGRCYGRGETEPVGGWVRNALYANLPVGLLVAGLLFLLYFFVDRLGQPVELLPLIRPYLLVNLLSLLFVVPFNVFRQFTDGITHTSVAMWVMLGGNLLNIALNYLLIFGGCGLPALGLLGAGLATLSARLFMLVAMLLLFFAAPRYRIYRNRFLSSAFDRRSFLQLNRLGWPIALQIGMEAASFSFSGVMMGWIGATALAAHQVLNTVSTLCYLVFYGLGTAVAIRVSAFLGQQNCDGARRAAYAGFHLMLLYMVCMVGLLFATRHCWVAWFTDDLLIRRLVLSLFPIFVLYQVGDSMQINFANALRATADVRPLVAISLFAYVVVSLSASCIFAFVLGWGAQGIWMGFPFGLTTAGVLFFLRFRQKMRAAC